MSICIQILIYLIILEFIHLIEKKREWYYSTLTNRNRQYASSHKRNVIFLLLVLYDTFSFFMTKWRGRFLSIIQNITENQSAHPNPL